MALLKNNPMKPASLEERIQTLRNQLDDEIDRRATEVKRDMPGVPLGVVRSILIRSSTCQCAAMLSILDQESAS
jgi:hypothetical protein